MFMFLTSYLNSGENVEEAFLETAKKIYQNIQDGRYSVVQVFLLLTSLKTLSCTPWLLIRHPYPNVVLLFVRQSLNRIYNPTQTPALTVTLTLTLRKEL